MLDLQRIDKSWTLFLDRDGVINHEKKEDYVYNWDEFIFYDGVLEALRILNGKFGRIVMVTNQRGIGRGLMTDADLHAIHTNMMAAITEAGGRIDKIYYCPANDKTDPSRKPNPGMAFSAKRDYPEIDLHRSLIVGNKLSDMQFGRNAGMHTVYVRNTHPEQGPDPSIDLAFNDLADFANTLQLA
jgi:D-glycero-D-manno-heptose 1,7-bisphosphate phosphatase